MAKHAFLSASASHRWINCPPSAKLCEGIKDESSHYAQEGTDCHELCAYLVEMALGRDVEDPTENLTYYSGEMQNCAEEYRDYVLEQFERSKKAIFSLLMDDPQISNALKQVDLKKGKSQAYEYVKKMQAYAKEL